MSNVNDVRNVILNVALMLSLASVVLGALALAVAFVALTPDTVLVASVTWVSPSDIPALEAEYWDNNVVPLCTDLPTIQNFGAEAESVACFLKAVK